MIKKIKQLREETGVGLLDCRSALEACNGDVDAAKVHMRKQGIIDAKSRGHKATPEGVISVYQHVGNRICAMVEINCETDFVARNEKFKTFAHDVAMHIAAARPQWIKREDVPKSIIDTEKDIILSKIGDKPDAVKEKILSGKLDKFFKDNCLMEQTFIKDQKVTIQDLCNSIVIKLKENIVIRKFSRFEIGE